MKFRDIVEQLKSTPPHTDINLPLGTPIGQRIIKLMMPSQIRGVVMPVELTQESVNLAEDILPGSIVIKLPNVKTNQPNTKQIAVAQSYDALLKYNASMIFGNLFYVPTVGGTVPTLTGPVLSPYAYNKQQAVNYAISAVWLAAAAVVNFNDNVYFASTTGSIYDDCDLFVQLPQVTGDIPYLVAYTKADAHVATASQIKLNNYRIINVETQYGGEIQEFNNVYLCEIQNGISN